MTGRAPLPLPDALSLSGLTRAQIGRLFGVSYRTVASWLRTGHLPAVQQPQAARVAQVVTEALDSTSAATARLALLNSSSGRSLYQQLLDQVPDRQQIQVPPLTATQQVS